ncbi:MAG: thiamine diphosphokinase [Chloroflexi bacterium]|nr:thiamine diphosphokinase [Chloroflexota bacterium]
MTHRSRVVIFTNGECDPPEEVHRWLEGRWVLCADGGTLHALALGLHPDVVIGDLDSLPEAVRDRLEAAGTQFLRFPRDKDYTDLELALQYALGQGAEDILLLGLLGGRLDQTLANVLLLARPEWDAARLWFAYGSERAYLLRGGESLTLRGRPGDIVSLIPLTPTVTGVTTQGLRWPLHNATLHFGHTLTVSNELVGEEAVVRVGEGRVVVTVSND